MKCFLNIWVHFSYIEMYFFKYIIFSTLQYIFLSQWSHLTKKKHKQFSHLLCESSRNDKYHNIYSDEQQCFPFNQIIVLTHVLFHLIFHNLTI